MRYNEQYKISMNDKLSQHTYNKEDAEKMVAYLKRIFPDLEIKLCELK